MLLDLALEKRREDRFSQVVGESAFVQLRDVFEDGAGCDPLEATERGPTEDAATPAGCPTALQVPLGSLIGVPPRGR